MVGRGKEKEGEGGQMEGKNNRKGEIVEGRGAEGRGEKREKDRNYYTLI